MDTQNTKSGDAHTTHASGIQGRIFSEVGKAPQASAIGHTKPKIANIGQITRYMLKNPGVCFSEVGEVRGRAHKDTKTHKNIENHMNPCNIT